MKSKQHILWLVLSLLAFASVARAHQDRLLELNGTVIQGLPAKYSPATLDVSEGILAVGAHRLRFTPLLNDIFSDDVAYDLQLSASWYHEPDVLPPYVAIKVRPRHKEFEFSLLFNLETLDLIKADIVVLWPKGRTRHFPIDISEGERKALLEATEAFTPKT